MGRPSAPVTYRPTPTAPVIYQSIIPEEDFERATDYINELKGERAKKKAELEAQGIQPILDKFSEVQKAFQEELVKGLQDTNKDALVSQQKNTEAIQNQTDAVVTLTKVIAEKPEKLNYPQNYPKYRFYGNNIKKMIDIAVSWDQGELKDKLIYVIANHMKKCFLTWNKDTVDDKVIFEHIFELSDGKIKLDRDSKPLTDSKDLIIMSNKRFSKSPKKGKKSYRNYKRK